MIRVLAQWVAKKTYIFGQEFQAATAELNSKLALKNAEEKRALIAQWNKEADDIDANIKKVDEQLATGYWECENGHEEPPSTAFAGIELEISRKCSTCHSPMRLITCAAMTGQEKTQSDRERNEAQTIAANKRAQAKAEEPNVEGIEQTANFLKAQSANSRTVAQKIRSL